MIARMQERISLLKAEVESRGSSWLEFQSAEEVKGEEGEGRLVNGEAHVGDESGDRSSAWTDGTFQTGRIVNGDVRMNGVPNSHPGGGTLDDEALRRALEERMGPAGDDDEGMHL